MELYNKYRPVSSSELLGNNFDIEGFLKKENHNRFFVFHGPSGVGKSSCGIILAKTVGAFETEVMNVNCADETGVDTIRKYMSYTQYPPCGPAWVLIFNEVHRLSTAAQDSLNDFVEFGLRNTYVIFTTTEPGKIIPALMTRATEVQFLPLIEDDLFTLVKRISKAEGFSIDNEVLSQIAERSHGSARKAITLLESVASGMPLPSVKEDMVELRDLSKAVLDKDWPKIVSIIEKMTDPAIESVRRMIVGYLLAVLKKKVRPDPAIVKQLHYLSEIAPYGDKNWLLLQIAKGF